jgi:WD40 repeat protein
MAISLVELTSSSRSILYSAHMLWEGADHILVAAGTAFGEIILWSWYRNAPTELACRIHRTFLGHEGSIFGVRISLERYSLYGQRQRFLASCSDDRTIRIWDIAGTVTNEDGGDPISYTEFNNQRTRHTGFNNTSYDAESSKSDCVAVGWGHQSRVWSVKFLESRGNDVLLPLLSSGEDASSRLWKFDASNDEFLSGAEAVPLTLEQMSNAAYHSGKNIWSTELFKSRKVICGGADSALTAYVLPLADSVYGNAGFPVREYTVGDVLTNESITINEARTSQIASSHKSSKVAEFFRSYAFIDSTSFILTANSGKVFVESLTQNVTPTRHGSTADQTLNSKLIDQLNDFSGYSICAAESLLGIGFIAGSKGSIYAYHSTSSILLRIHQVQGKIGSMFVSKTSLGPDSQTVALLVTLMGQKRAQLLFITIPKDFKPRVLRTVDIQISESLTGLTITSMIYVYTDSSEMGYMFLGFRGGSVAAYTIHTSKTELDDKEEGIASLFRIIERVHAKETVTSMLWNSFPSDLSAGHLISVGRDGCCAIHAINLTSNSISLVHYLTLSFGPNIEGLYFHNGHLISYGFSSTRFVVCDTTTEQDIMNVETGGSHRSWSFHPKPSKNGGGTLVWTRASSMHVCTQDGPNHQVIRSGGHGREVKAVAVSSTGLVATGAEDTDIKIFEYINADFVCRRTLRKHTTGIQHLQWSEDGSYLFSSGGCEEFYIWRVHNLQSPLGIGVVCEAVCKPESEHSDLRVMSFDVRRLETDQSGFIIAIVFSDSSMRIYSYDVASAVKWHTLAKGMYFTSCLTQCVFLSPSTILTAGTDGHAVLWPRQADAHRSHVSMPSPPENLTWKQPARIHQSTSKTLDSKLFEDGRTLVVSGGDDGSLAFLLTAPRRGLDLDLRDEHVYLPIIVIRAHASAITACTLLSHNKLYVLTSGNDQWVRLWEVNFVAEQDVPSDPIIVKRVTKMKTNVADVSSMAILSQEEAAIKVIICGVGMEVIRLDWST